MISHETVLAAHEASSATRGVVEASQVAGCFCCFYVYPAIEIVEYADRGYSPICPYCHADTVIPDAAGWEPTPELLEALEEHWIGYRSRERV